MKNMITKMYVNAIIMILGMSAFFFIGLGHVHLFDWDEINFAESAREMIVSGNYLSVQIDFEPFWEKPPLFFWMQVIAMKLFGVNELSARLPNAIFGCIYLWTLFDIGKKLSPDTAFNKIWMLMVFGSILPHIYFKSGIIDPVFNYFIFISIYFFYKVFQSGGTSRIDAFLSGIFCGLSFLTKGPVGLLLLICTVGIVGLLLLLFEDTQHLKINISSSWNRLKLLIFSKHIWYPLCIFGGGFILIVSIWIGAELYFHGLEILTRFVEYQIELFTTPVASHGQPFYYHFIVVFLGCFPASVFALPYIIKFFKKDTNPFLMWMVTLFWVVMIIFSISTTKIVHYSSMAYLPLTFLAALHIQNRISNKQKFSTVIITLFLVLGILWSIIFFIVPYILMNTAAILPYIKDPVVVQVLLLPSIMKGYEPIIGVIFFVGIIISSWHITRKKLYRATQWMAASVGTTLLMTNMMILPAIESLSQGSAIHFYKTLEGKDVYIETIGFKSYAHYFYSKTRPKTNSKAQDKEWLLRGKIDKDSYFVTKSNNVTLDTYPDIQKIRSEGGFSFYMRKKMDN